MKLKVTAFIEDDEGDMLCLSCKHVFGIINGSAMQDKGASANYCPHCGARSAATVFVHDVSEVVEVEECDAE